MLLHHTEESGLASRCLNVDHLAFCRKYSLKVKKKRLGSKLKKKKKKSAKCLKNPVQLYLGKPHCYSFK